MSGFEPDSVVPSFSLLDQEGETFSLWDYRHRQPVVLFLVGSQSQQIISSVQASLSRYQQVGALPVVVSFEREPDADVSFPVLHDATREVTARYVQHTPTVLVLDRYGAFRGEYTGPWDPEPDHSEIISLVLFTESDCPECGVPEWH
ncbi:MAG TPA: redoxin domain-containing protein [Acidobacteriota bacterium]|nr:redoxin domain-containing protein [Acidobacteriota bacterium]